MIENIDVSRLVDDGRKTIVGMVDSGFSKLPSYAVLHGAGHQSGTEHGDRVLAVFTALDRKFPLQNLELHLSCYDPKTGYDGLAYALSLLPECDILSISLSWKDDDVRIRSMLSSRFGKVCAPYSWDDLPYPASYSFVTSCSNGDNPNADWSICPNAEWNGNSYAVPAVARLMAHGIDKPDHADGMPVAELFSDCGKGIAVLGGKSRAGKMSCPHCHRFIRNGRTHGFMVTDFESCPYCGLPLAGE